MLVLSLDAVGSGDLEYLKTLPMFKAFYNRAAGCEEVTSVYPSLTYPAHTSIVTGRYPKNHGIVNNLLIQPERETPDWFWQRKYIKGTTLYDEARKQGMSTAALLWPVTGGAKIRYNLPEVIPNRPWQNQTMVSLCNGTPFYEWELQRKFGHLRDGIRQPQLDNFVFASLLYTVAKYKPDLLLAHLTDVDTNRHLYGVHTVEATAALERHDRRLGQLDTLLKKLDLWKNTNLIVLGDHYQKDVSYAVHPNYVFLEKGWLRVSGRRVTDFRVIARDCDGSCYVYVKDTQLKEEVGKTLEILKARKDSGIARIFTSLEAAALGADPACAFLLEAEPGYYFQNGFEVYCIDGKRSSDLLKSDHHGNFQIQKATHGYLPDQDGYRTIFLASGPDFKAGVRLERMSLVDIGPTLAYVLGVDLGQADGQAIKEFLDF